MQLNAKRSNKGGPVKSWGGVDTQNSSGKMRLYAANPTEVKAGPQMPRTPLASSGEGSKYVNGSMLAQSGDAEFKGSNPMRR